MGNIGIFGGTFDPIHQGHLALASQAREQFDLEKVLFVPAFIPPHKASRRDMAPAPYRYQMVEKAVQNIPGFEVSDIELNRPEISYTVETLRCLEKKYPDNRFFLLMGADSLAEISKWKEPEEILRMADLLVARRQGYAPAGKTPARVRWIEMPEFTVSSSEIRGKIQQGEHLPENILPKAVMEFIQKKNLYRGTQACR